MEEKLSKKSYIVIQFVIVYSFPLFFALIFKDHNFFQTFYSFSAGIIGIFLLLELNNTIICILYLIFKSILLFKIYILLYPKKEIAISIVINICLSFWGIFIGLIYLLSSIMM